MATGQWRQHPKLRDRFHPDHPDDLRVLVHEGGPRTTTVRPELMWVRVLGESKDAFLGSILNTPTQLNDVHAGSEILFVVPAGFEHPVRVTELYLAERAHWTIHPCSRCGMSELFDAPSTLAAKVFPGVAEIQMFSALCAVCGGAQVVENSNKRQPPRPAPKSCWGRLFSGKN